MEYFNISWFSRKDGPGNRVVLFLQGCNLHCVWCHSPHSISQSPPVLFYEEYCKNCGNCIGACQVSSHILVNGKHLYNRERCVNCGRCILQCTNNALERKFYKETPSMIFDKLKDELMLLKDIGGITISGGEPLLQHLELKEFLKLCKNSGINTCIETSGGVEKKCFVELYEYVDCWLFGLKQTDEKLCKGMIGADINVILDNLKFLSQKQSEKIIIRTPIIPNYTDGNVNIRNIIDIMIANKLKRIQLLPINPYTYYYYKVAGVEINNSRFKALTELQLNSIKEHFEISNINVELVR